MSYSASVRMGEIEIEVFDYENPAAQNIDDASWLNSQITVKAALFLGAFRTSLTTWDVKALLEQMIGALKNLSGEVSFKTTEGDLTLNVAFSRRGTAEVKGSVQPHGTPKTTLQYHFEVEPSALEEMVRALKAISERFPAKQIQGQ